MNRFARALPVLVLCSFAGAALAGDRSAAPHGGQDRTDPVSMTFRYDPRDLTTPQGASRIYSRMLIAARRQCTIPGSRLTELRSVDERCMLELMDKAVAQARSVQLAARHRSLEDVAITARR